MKIPVRIIPILLILLLATPTMAAQLLLGNFSSGDLTGWNNEKFKGRTTYELVMDDGRTVLKAHSVKTASGLLRKVKIDSQQFPLLRWSWKVEHTLKGEDVTRKTGDDFAARVYVVFPRFFFWQTRAINYVWAARMPKGSSAPNPYTSSAMIVAVESGDGKAGEWIVEERNYYEDYLKLFGEEPPSLGAIAIMTDTDDTGGEATAYYGDIFLESTK